MPTRGSGCIPFSPSFQQTILRMATFGTGAVCMNGYKLSWCARSCVYSLVRHELRSQCPFDRSAAHEKFNSRASTLGTHYIRRFHRKTDRARTSTREHARGHPELDEQGHRYDAPTSAAQKSPQHPRAATPTPSIHGEGPHTPSHDVTDRTKSPWTSFARQAAGTPDDPLPSVRPLSARRPLPTLCRRTCDARLSLFTSPHLIRTRTALTGTI